MTKLRAFLIHLSVSATIVGAILAVVFFIWYPYPYFEVSGAAAVVRVLIFVDLILGPLLTLILYRPGKPGLKFDMSCIFAIQLVALIYGTQVIYSERPAYLVFAVDRFEVLAHAEIDPASVPPELSNQKPLTGPLITIARMPATEQGRQKLLDEVLEGKPDIERRPERWELFAPNTELVFARAKPLTEIAAARPDVSTRINDFIESSNATGTLHGIPVRGKNGAYCLVLDQDSRQPVGIIDFDPWVSPALPEQNS